LGEQFGRTRSAFLGLIASHIDLAKAEFSEIGGEIKRAAALGGAAFGLVFAAGILVFVGAILWLDEWAFGSIGWGVLHGGFFLVAVAVTLVLLILPDSAPRVGLGFFVALIVAVVVFLVLWLQLTSRAWGWVGSTFFGGLTLFGHAISSADRPVFVAAIFLAGLFAVLGALIGLFFGRGFRRILYALAFAVVATIVGAGLGAFLGVPMSWGISIAVALTVFLPVWPIVSAIFIFRHGVDTAKLRERFVPTQTIETTKETIEWVREQLPLARKS
jgi:hypothetical protein